MSNPYCTGPCFCYVGIPAQIAGLLPASSSMRTVPNIPNALQAIPELPVVAGGFDAAMRTAVPANQVVQTYVLNVLRLYVPFYLGTSERGFTIEPSRSFRPVYMDEGGKSKPWDRLYEGTDAWVDGTINVYNEAVYAVLASTAGGSVFALPPFNFRMPRGIDLEGYVGTMMVTEGACFPLWLVFPYAGKPAMFPLPGGYRFFFCTLEGDTIRNGTAIRSVHTVFYAARGYASGAWVLFDHDVSGLPLPN